MQFLIIDLGATLVALLGYLAFQSLVRRRAAAPSLARHRL
jgi:hypothetical protein